MFDIIPPTPPSSPVLYLSVLSLHTSADNVINKSSLYLELSENRRICNLLENIKVKVLL